MKVFVIAEIGINHNGDLNIAKKLIDVASIAGCDAVKFQKRTIDAVYTQEYLDGPRESAWGNTQRAQKEGLEFSEADYHKIEDYCKNKNIQWLASSWDTNSQTFLSQFNSKYNKVASAMLTNLELMELIAKEKKHTFISVGMSTYEEIDNAIAIFKKYDCEFEILHCNSCYPSRDEDANLLQIVELRKRYGCNVGYSSHEVDSLTSIGAVALGATSIEKHITMDRNMYGSDQKASIEPAELILLVKQIRTMEKALGNGVKTLSEAEMEVRKKLRG